MLVCLKINNPMVCEFINWNWKQLNNDRVKVVRISFIKSLWNITLHFSITHIQLVYLKHNALLINCSLSRISEGAKNYR